LTAAADATGSGLATTGVDGVGGSLAGVGADGDGVAAARGAAAGGGASDVCAAFGSAWATVGHGVAVTAGAGGIPKTSTATWVINGALTCGSRAEAASVKAVAHRLFAVRMIPPEY
jgi:hypothetical protein